jgi:hypothetical protein
MPEGEKFTPGQIIASTCWREMLAQLIAEIEASDAR